MIQNIDTTKYLSIKDVANATKIPERTLKYRCNKHKYQTRTIVSVGGNRGKKYEILVSSLEPELQEKIYSYIKSSFGGSDCLAPIFLDNNKNLITSNSNCAESGKKSSALSLVRIPTKTCGDISNNHLSVTIPLFLNDNEDNNKRIIPEDARRIALAKYDVIDMWQRYRAGKPNKKQADNEFIAGYNSGFLAEELFKLTGKLSRASLYRWRKLLKGNSDYKVLVNDYNYTGESQFKTALSELEQKAFNHVYYNDAQMNLGAAYSLIKYQFEKRGMSVHSESAYRAYEKYIRRYHKDYAVLSRKGEKALNDTVGMYLHRDISDVKPGDVLVADGNKLDFTVLNPFTGRPVRATMVVYLDWISFDVAGYEIMLSENTQCISSALRNSILRLGKIPKRIYMDNGKAFRSQYFAGCKSFTDCGFRGVYENLGIELMIARAYSGRSKVVERFFRNFVQSAPPTISSYIGNCIENRPAHHRRNEKFHKEIHQDDKIPTIEQAKQMLESWLEYYRSQPCPHDKTKTVGQVFQEGCGAGVDTDMLDELMLASSVRSVKRNIIRIFGLEYSSAGLYGIDTKVIVKYSLFDISKIKVYTLKNEYICEAPLVTYVKAIVKDGSAVDMYNYKMQLKQQKALINYTKKKTKAIMAAAKNLEAFEWSQPTQNLPTVKKPKKKLDITIYENIQDINKRKISY